MHMFRGQRSRSGGQSRRQDCAGPTARTPGASARSKRTLTALTAVVFASSLALTACGQAGSHNDESAAEDAAHRPPAAAAASGAAGSGAGSAAADADGTASGSGRTGTGTSKGNGSSQLADVHIIRTASLTVRVKDVPAAIEKARAAVEDAGGIIGDETTDRDTDGGERSRLVLRVPQENYAGVLNALAGSGELVSRTVKAEDVTEQVVDVDSRIKSQRASVERVRKLMDQATDLSDVVSLEGELSNREADLESLLAQQASLKDRTALATITLSLTEPAPKKKAAHKDDHDEVGFLDALSGGWHGLITVLRWLAVALGAILPFAVPLGLLLVLWVRLIRPRLPVRRPRPAGPQPPAFGRRPADQPAQDRRRTPPSTGQPPRQRGHQPGEASAAGPATAQRAPGTDVGDDGGRLSGEGNDTTTP